MDDSFAAPSTHSPSSSPPRFYLFLIVVLLLGAALVATTRIRAQETGSSLLRLQWATFDPREVEQKMPAGALGLVDPEKAWYGCMARPAWRRRARCRRCAGSGPTTRPSSSARL